MNQDSAAAPGLWQRFEEVTVGERVGEKHILWNGQMRCFAILIGSSWHKFHTAVSQTLTQTLYGKASCCGEQQTSPGRGVTPRGNVCPDPPGNRRQ